MEYMEHLMTSVGSVMLAPQDLIPASPFLLDIQLLIYISTILGYPLHLGSFFMAAHSKF